MGRLIWEGGRNYFTKRLFEMVISSDRLRQFQDWLPPSVNLLAVSKGHPSKSIYELAQLGQRDFGESRIQEALPKLDALRK